MELNEDIYNNGTVSVIVPVYGVERYLLESVDSICRQTFENLEIVLIDDASPDSCPEMCDQYTFLDQRLITVHKVNGGAASARNAGLMIATGEYLSFVDSDDSIDENAYSVLVEKMQKNNNAKVVQFGFRDQYKNRIIEKAISEKEILYSINEYLKRYTIDWTCGLIWNKFFKRELFNDIYFETGHIVDDEFFTYQGIMNADNIISIPDVLYNYRRRYSSVTNRPEYGERIINDKIDYLELRRGNIQRRFPALKKTFDRHFAQMLFILFQDTFATKKTNNRIKKVFMNNPTLLLCCDMNIGKLVLFCRIMLGIPISSIRNARDFVNENEEDYFL